MYSKVKNQYYIITDLKKWFLYDLMKSDQIKNFKEKSA